MSGERNLETLLKKLSATLADGVFVFATLKGDQIPDGLSPQMVFREAEGTTLILRQAEAAAIPHEFACRMITLNVHSALEAVGFIARVATALAAHGMGVNPVSGFYHDHLFIPDGREAEALHILTELAAQASD